ncbi:hypothetical protein H5T51_09355 [Candidatus Bathyarchaeota archaeon]|nr:hypothetical protein [Candidatus Bathyarchaeota archaeon]
MELLTDLREWRCEVTVKMGNMNFRRLLLLTALVMVMVSSMLMPCAYSIDASINEKAMSFIREVIGLDVPKYTVSVQDYFEEYSTERTVKKDITYIFNGDENRLSIMCRFDDEVLYSCIVWVEEGTPFYIQPSENPFTRAISILERYKTWSRDDSLNEIIDMLNTVNPSKNTTIRTGNWTLKVSKKADSTWLYWLYTVNGILFPNCISITIKGDGGISFSDTRKLYRIGSVDVRVSMDQAVAIALEYMKNYSFEIFMGDQPSIVVKNFTIVRDKIVAELLSWPREDGAQYPYWRVDLPLDQLYPGNIYMICVNIWADTGEVFRCVPLGFGGGPPPQNEQMEQIAPPQQENLSTPPPEGQENLAENTSEWSSTQIAVTILLILAILFSALILYRRRRMP